MSAVQILILYKKCLSYENIFYTTKYGVMK